MERQKNNLNETKNWQPLPRILWVSGIIKLQTFRQNCHKNWKEIVAICAKMRFHCKQIMHTLIFLLIFNVFRPNHSKLAYHIDNDLSRKRMPISELQNGT